MSNTFKVNNKDTRTTSLTSHWCLYYQFWTYSTPFSNTSIDGLMHVNICWGALPHCHNRSQCILSLPPENTRKPFGFMIFSGVEKVCIGNEWVKIPKQNQQFRCCIVWNQNASIIIISLWWGTMKKCLAPTIYLRSENDFTKSHNSWKLELINWVINLSDVNSNVVNSVHLKKTVNLINLVYGNRELSNKLERCKFGTP